MIALLIALVGAGVVVTAFLGYRNFRSDPLTELAPEDRVLVNERGRRRTATGPLSRLGQRLSPSLARMLGTGYRKQVDHLIDLADGNPYKDFEQFMAYKISLGFVMGGAGVAVAMLVKSPIVIPILLIVGFFLPDLQLRQAGRKRQSEIDDALPDFLDVLAVTVSAGLSFRSSLRKVVERTDGPLAVEMQRTLRQMEVGEPRTVAFTNLRKRTESDALEKFVVALVQAEELGAPLVDALDQIALDMRRDTAQRARQQASKASPQIAGVVTMVMVPGTMVLILATMWFGSGFDSMELF